jgi:hypothetical protein
VQHAKNKSSPPYLASLEIFALRPSSVFRQSQKRCSRKLVQEKSLSQPLWAMQRRSLGGIMPMGKVSLPISLGGMRRTDGTINYH